MTDRRASADGVAKARSQRDALVARSLDSAREKAEQRVEKFLDTARELMTTSPLEEVTLQRILDQSGQSIRSFYQHFAGKHELLLVLFEERVQSTALHVQGVVDKEAEPLARLRCFITAYYRLCRPAGRRQPADTPFAMTEFARQLLISHPAEATKAFAPIVSLFEQLLDEGSSAGIVRSGLRNHRIAGAALQAVMFSAFADTIAGDNEPAGADGADDLLELILHGICTFPG